MREVILVVFWAMVIGGFLSGLVGLVQHVRTEQWADAGAGALVMAAMVVMGIGVAALGWTG